MKTVNVKRFPAAGRFMAGALSAWMVFCCAGPGRAAETGRIEDLVRQWVMLRKELSGVENEWKEQKPLLEDELKLLKKRQEQLKQEIEKQKSTRTGFKDTLKKSRQEKQRYVSALQKLEKPLENARSHLTGLRRPLPLFMQDSLVQNFDGIRREKAGEKNIDEQAGLLQGLFSLYRKLEALNGDVHAKKVVMEDPDGKKREMDVLFLGTAFGFAVSADDSTAASGQLASGGMKWTWAPEHAHAIRSAWKIYHKEDTARFVSLPVTFAGPKEQDNEDNN
jgi:uncharacterized protein YukE